MKLPTFRKDNAAGLVRTEQALTAAETKIAALEDDRRVALAESDVAAPVITIDKAIAEERVAAAIHRDRIGALRTAVAEEQAAEIRGRHCRDREAPDRPGGARQRG